jgi:SET domain-containing protein|tara:strand:- start:136 stop:462 length:327 start_codon:yes stop_codon:yes gene_type:complete
MKQFEDTYKPLPEGLTIMESKIEGLGLYAQEDFLAGYEFGETHVFAVSTNRREWVRTPLGGFINHSENPNCYINTEGEERRLYSVRPITSGEEITVYYRFESYDGMTA